MKDNYRIVGGWYDKLAAVYSFGQIGKCRRGFLETVKSGESFLFLGVGQGTEAIEVALKGGKATVLDNSPKMLAQFEEKLKQKGEDFEYPVEVIQADVRDWEGGKLYDKVVCNFFLNVFYREDMEDLLERVLQYVKDGGGLIISDFLLEKEQGWIVRSIQKLNWYVALCVFRLFAKNAFHSIYDYEQVASTIGVKKAAHKKYGLLGVKLYHTIELVRR